MWSFPSCVSLLWAQGGLGLPGSVINLIFLAVIVVLVSYLSISHVDRIDLRTGSTKGYAR